MMSPNILQALVTMVSAVALLLTHGVSTEIYEFFSAARQNNVIQCAVDNQWPPQSMSVRSVMQCALKCRQTTCCLMFNVVRLPAGGSINCQTFNHTPRSLQVVSGCTAYAVRLFDTALVSNRAVNYYMLTFSIKSSTLAAARPLLGIG
jgi:hypothetical protein